MAKNCFMFAIPAVETCWQQAPVCAYEYGTDYGYGTWKITYGNGTASEAYSYFSGPSCAASLESHKVSERFSLSLSGDGKLARTTLEEMTWTLYGKQALADALNNASSASHCICGGTWTLATPRTFGPATCNASTCPHFYKRNPSLFTPKVMGTNVEQVTLNPNGKAPGAVEGCVLRRTAARVGGAGPTWADEAGAKAALADLSLRKFERTPFTRCDGHSCSTASNNAAWAKPMIMVLVVIIPVIMCAVTYKGYKYKVNRLEDGARVELSDLTDDGGAQQPTEAQISVSNQATVM